MRLMDERPFVELIAALRVRGRASDAEALESLRVVGWMSSREMVEELGNAVGALDLPHDLQAVAERCMKEVRGRLR
jgi:hypothetical protein